MLGQNTTAERGETMKTILSRKGLGSLALLALLSCTVSAGLVQAEEDSCSTAQEQLAAAQATLDGLSTQVRLGEEGLSRLVENRDEHYMNASQAETERSDLGGSVTSIQEQLGLQETMEDPEAYNQLIEALGVIEARIAELGATIAYEYAVAADRQPAIDEIESNLVPLRASKDAADSGVSVWSAIVADLCQ
jgi:hypothetical protein